MTTEPTAKHQEEAREIVIKGFRNVHRFPNAKAICDGLITDIAAALSSRDREIREVLEGLVVSVIDGENCWCPDPFRADIEKHDPACLAARGLWERVRG